MESRCRILTVGDGDLTLSLALARAYGRDHVSVTASVLDSKDELLASFPDAPLCELQDLQVPVVFHVDATQLHHLYGPQEWDLIIFHHPHLGLASLSDDESLHATCHHQLLCHYLYSAAQVAKKVHLCLCGNQRQTWQLDRAAERQGLHLWKELSTTVPFCQIWTNVPLVPTEATTTYAAPRRYRNGKLGSRHFLGKYGYRHRRTAGERYQGGSLDMNVAGSMHYVFQQQQLQESSFDYQVPEEVPSSTIDATFECCICGAQFSSQQSLNDHYSTPARPQFAEMSNQLLATTAENQESTLPAEQSNKDSTEKRSEHLPVDGPKSKPTGPGVQGETKFEIHVNHHDAGKRLRQFLQHNLKLSKRQAELAVQNGTVWIDGVQTPDSSRIVQTGMLVQIVSEQPNTDSVIAPSGDAVVKVLHHDQPFLVVNKPSGTRTKGAMVGTLEQIISQQQGTNYESLSKLDTSCSGLCVLVPQTNQRLPTLPTILHSMLALVHGHVPDNWFPQHQHSVLVQRKWKNKKRKCGVGEQNESDALALSDSAVITIVPLERMTPIAAAEGSTDSSSCLSTVRIETEYPSAASICQWMRHLGYPVVGDLNCHKEYLKLKRSIRNRIKNKLCITCYKVQWQDQRTNSMINYPLGNPPIPEKLSALYWESNFTLTDPVDKNET